MGNVKIANNIKKQSVLINRGGQVLAEGESAREVTSKIYGAKGRIRRPGLKRPGDKEV